MSRAKTDAAVGGVEKGYGLMRGETTQETTSEHFKEEMPA